jgi:hypothetical protein
MQDANARQEMRNTQHRTVKLQRGARNAEHGGNKHPNMRCATYLDPATFLGGSTFNTQRAEYTNSSAHSSGGSAASQLSTAAQHTRRLRGKDDKHATEKPRGLTLQLTVTLSTCNGNVQQISMPRNTMLCTTVQRGSSLPGRALTTAECSTLHAACRVYVVRWIGPNLPGRATLRFEAHGRDRRALLVLHSNPIRFVALRAALRTNYLRRSA